MAWKTSAKIKSPKRTRRDLWVGFKPYGIGETKPNHYKEMFKTRLGEPRQPPVRVAHPAQGRVRRLRARRRRVPRLDALGCAPVHDAPEPPAHQHDGRARSLASSPTSHRCDGCATASCATSDGWPTRWCGDAGEPGFTQVSWDEALDLIADRIRATTPDRLAVYLTARGITNETYYVAQKFTRFLGTNNIDNAAPRLPRAVDHHAEEDDRRRRHHVLATPT